MMSFFRWLWGKSAPKAPHKAVPHDLLKSGGTPQGTDIPVAPAHARNERMERREALYMVVRDAMVRAGVLSASYKFKVLALDPRGLQFLVMMDLAREYAAEAVRLSEIEALIFQTAKARHEITVTAVYWRINDQMAAAIAPKGVAPQGAGWVHPATAAAPPAPVPSAAAKAPLASVQAPLPGPVARPPASTPPASMPAPEHGVRLVAPRFDPIEPDEVAAFKRALASAAAARVPAAAPGVALRTGARRGAPPSADFADTEMPEQDSRAQSLSNTQYGEL